MFRALSATRPILCTRLARASPGLNARNLPMGPSLASLPPGVPRRPRRGVRGARPVARAAAPRHHVPALLVPPPLQPVALPDAPEARLLLVRPGDRLQVL